MCGLYLNDHIMLQGVRDPVTRKENVGIPQ